MSVTMTKAEGITVFTLTSDPSESVCPPMCQIFKSLCYSPVCCSVSQHLKVQKPSQSILGTLHIMVGLLNMGLAAILRCSHSGSWWQMDDSGFPFWMGGLFVLFGIVGIVSEKYPSPCVVFLNVILNFAGVGFAIAAIVLYSINMPQIYIWWMCNNYDDYYNYYGSRHRYGTTVPPPPGKQFMKEKCFEGRNLVVMILRGINVVLIVLSVLELCLVISSFVLGIKSLRRREKGEKEKIGEPELYRPLLEEVTTQPTA